MKSGYDNGFSVPASVGCVGIDRWCFDCACYFACLYNLQEGVPRKKEHNKNTGSRRPSAVLLAVARIGAYHSKPWSKLYRQIQH
ncbi:hypothetical protein D3C73_1578780 [compost metagenome]